MESAIYKECVGHTCPSCNRHYVYRNYANPNQDGNNCSGNLLQTCIPCIGGQATDIEYIDSFDFWVERVRKEHAK